jgi:hypothetical protein
VLTAKIFEAFLQNFRCRSRIERYADSEPSAVPAEFIWLIPMIVGQIGGKCSTLKCLYKKYLFSDKISKILFSGPRELHGAAQPTSHRCLLISVVTRGRQNTRTVASLRKLRIPALIDVIEARMLKELKFILQRQLILHLFNFVLLCLGD